MWSNCLTRSTMQTVAETWRRVWWGRKNFRGPRFREKFPFSRQKFLMTFFLVVDQIFRIFPFFSQIFCILTMLNVVYDPFLTRKTPFFTLFKLSRASDNTTSLNIGGTDAWAVPPPHILGDRPRSPPLGLRPWRQAQRDQGSRFLLKGPTAAKLFCYCTFHRSSAYVQRPKAWKSYI